MPDSADLFGHEHLARPIFGGDLVRLAPWAQRDLQRRAETVWTWGKAGSRGFGQRAQISAARCAAGFWWTAYSYDLWGADWGECGGGTPFVHAERDRHASVTRTAKALLSALSNRHKPAPKAARALDREWRPALLALMQGAQADA